MYTVLIMMMIIPSERALCKIQAVGVVCAHRHSLKVHTCAFLGYVDGEFCLPCMDTCLILPEVFPKLFARCPPFSQLFRQYCWRKVVSCVYLVFEISPIVGRTSFQIDNMPNLSFRVPAYLVRSRSALIQHLSQGGALVACTSRQNFI